MLFVVVGHAFEPLAELRIRDRRDNLQDLEGETMLSPPRLGKPGDKLGMLIDTWALDISPHGTQRCSDLVPQAHGRCPLSYPVFASI